MQDITRIRRHLFEVAPRMAFVGVGLSAVAFSSSGENPNTDIEVWSGYLLNISSTVHMKSHLSPLTLLLQV
jgi:hypothetical protein